MKIAVASDIHGSLTYARAFLDKAEKFGADKIVLLGDLYYHGVRNELPDCYKPIEVARLLDEYREKIIVVRGNCDSDVDLTVSHFDFHSSVVLFIGGKTVYCTHGDKVDKDHLPSGKYDALLYGHYHTGFIEKRGDLLIANPGSVSLPKGGTTRSFLLLNDGKVRLVSLAGDVLAEADL